VFLGVIENLCRKRGVYMQDARGCFLHALLQLHEFLFKVVLQLLESLVQRWISVVSFAAFYHIIAEYAGVVPTTERLLKALQRSDIFLKGFPKKFGVYFARVTQFLQLDANGVQLVFIAGTAFIGRNEPFVLPSNISYSLLDEATFSWNGIVKKLFESALEMVCFRQRTNVLYASRGVPTQEAHITVRIICRETYTAGPIASFLGKLCGTNVQLTGLSEPTGNLSDDIVDNMVCRLGECSPQLFKCNPHAP